MAINKCGQCLAPWERAGVRGKRCSDKPMLNLMAVTLALPIKATWQHTRKTHTRGGDFFGLRVSAFLRPSLRPS